ncbi:MAG: hypothetical protein HFE84_02350 [Lachnospiraceae bacterium]|nr:hypothetical protein [Lachnospiraceae bacterium]
MAKTPRPAALEEKIRLTGIAGIGRSVGCTHFSVMLANYLAGYQRKRAALLEFNHSGAFARIEKSCTGYIRKEKLCRILEADYFKDAGPIELAIAFEKNYEELLIDFGDIEEDGWTEFLRCDRQFLIGSFSEWQQARFRDFELKKRPAERKSWQSLAVFGSEETRREFRKRYRIFTERIPFSADAFAVTEECARFFGRLMKDT